MLDGSGDILFFLSEGAGGGGGDEIGGRGVRGCRCEANKMAKEHIFNK